MNRPVLGFAVGISLLSALLCGVAPAFHAVRGDLQKGLARTGVNVNAAFQHSRFRSGLVIGQVALSLLLLTCAGLVARSFVALVRVDVGVQPKQIFLAEFIFPAHVTPRPTKRRPSSRDCWQLNSIPGVVSATELVGLPVCSPPKAMSRFPGSRTRRNGPPPLTCAARDTSRRSVVSCCKGAC